MTLPGPFVVFDRQEVLVTAVLAPPTIPPAVARAAAPSVPRGGEVYEGTSAALNEVLAAVEPAEQRLPMKVNDHGQWCTRGVGGWRPHHSYLAAYAAAHAEEVA